MRLVDQFQKHFLMTIDSFFPSLVNFICILFRTKPIVSDEIVLLVILRFEIFLKKRMIQCS